MQEQSYAVGMQINAVLSNINLYFRARYLALSSIRVRPAQQSTHLLHTGEAAATGSAHT